MLTLPVDITQIELTCKLDRAINSKATLINRWEPTFGQRIANAVLSPNYKGWRDMTTLRTISTTGVRSARSTGYYRSEVIADERQIYMTERQCQRAWDVLESIEMVGETACQRIQRYRKLDTLTELLQTFYDDVTVNCVEIAEIIISDIEASAAGNVRRDVPLGYAAYQHGVKAALRAADVPEETIEFVESIMELLVAFHADFAK